MADSHAIGLIVQATAACPLECAHCITDSGPKRRERFSRDELLAVIDEAAATGASHIGFTGGDPFLLRKDLVDAFSRASASNIQVVIVTSAYWAVTRDIAIKTLEPFAGLAMLGISADSYHAPFVPFGRIINAVEAAHAVGIGKIEIQVTGGKPEEADRIKRALGSAASYAAVRFQAVWPIGRARPMASKVECTPAEQLDLTCPMGAPFLMTDRKVVGCCSALIQLGEDNPLVLGDVRQQPLSHILKSAGSNSYYSFIKYFGLRPLVDHLVRIGRLHPGELRGTDVCHICYELHSSSETRNELQALIGNRRSGELANCSSIREVA